MKMNLTATAILLVLAAISATGRETASPEKPVAAPDKEKVSYAFGM